MSPLLLLWIVCAIPAFTIAGSIPFRSMTENDPLQAHADDVCAGLIMGALIGAIGIVAGPFTILAWLIVRYAPKGTFWRTFWRRLLNRVFWAHWTR